MGVIQYVTQGSRMDIKEALDKWFKYVDEQDITEKHKKFVKGHPFMFKDSQQFFDKVNKEQRR